MKDLVLDSTIFVHFLPQNHQKNVASPYISKGFVKRKSWNYLSMIDMRLFKLKA